MARTKKNKPGRAAREEKQARGAADANGHTQQPSPEELYTTAVTLAEQSQPQEAFQHAQKLWSAVQHGSISETLPALNLLGEISLELGDADTARAYFEEAAKRDPDGNAEGPLGGGAEKFLWLAQLCEEGGKQSVTWFEKGAQALQQEISALENGQQLGLDADDLLVMRLEKKRKLANALCGMVEVYMTDLSWEEDAEARCETLVTQAMTVEDETSAEVLQTLASVRLSQSRVEDAQAALKRSQDLWRDLDADDESIPEFAARISLARLLMEAQMEDDAMNVLERLILEDDQSVEAWYLGGWCQYLISEKSESGGSDVMAHDGDSYHPKEQEKILRGSRRWLTTALTLYKQLEYEDQRLREHAVELVSKLDGILGPEEVGQQDESEDEWDGIEEGENEIRAEDEEMRDAD